MTSSDVISLTQAEEQRQAVLRQQKEKEERRRLEKEAKLVAEETERKREQERLQAAEKAKAKQVSRSCIRIRQSRSATLETHPGMLWHAQTPRPYNQHASRLEIKPTWSP